jgi:uncharacterized protein YbjT (DUF2867 family)
VVNISVVGADRVPVESGVDRAMFGYFAAKRAAEQVIEGSGVPWTTLRATQFHEAMFALAKAMAKLPVVPVAAGFQFQPVAADEVAERLVELALNEPADLVPRSRRTEGVRDGRAGPRLPTSDRPKPTDPRDAGARRRRPRVPRRRESPDQPGDGPPHLGGLPRRAGARDVDRG